ncbi:MAG TPA: TerC family protein [Bryobacteraceae bacterium]|nr:TerC family protein [Bryobacteraceae bacterium]
MTSDWSQFILRGLSIILIDLLLAGDNALVLAMAVRGLPHKRRKKAIWLGAGAAVVLRILITIVAARLLGIEFLKLVGGALVVWIAVKVLADAGAHEKDIPARGRLLQAIWMIVFADITMSVDNVLAIAGAAAGNIPLIVFGLGVSIPLVVFSSNLIAKLMDRYAWIVYFGSAILGRVGGEMIMTDPWIERTFHPSDALTWTVEGVLVIAVVLVGRYFCHRQPSKPN